MAARLIIQRENGGKRLWRWKHKAGNNKIDDASEQGYRFRWYAAFKARRRYPGLEVTYK